MAKTSRIRTLILAGLLSCSAVCAWGAVTSRVLWQPKAGGAWVLAQTGKAVGGSIILRITTDKASNNPTVDSVTITEEKNPVHAVHPIPLKLHFKPIPSDQAKGAFGIQSDPIPTARFHNARHTIVCKVRIGGAQRKLVADVQFKNLVLSEFNDVPIVYDPKTPQPIFLSCVLNHAQSGLATVTYEIYCYDKANYKPAVVKEFKNVPYPGSHSWHWDGILPKDRLDRDTDYALCYLKITAVTQNGQADSDTNRSPYLRVAAVIDAHGKPNNDTEFLGYDDRGTPDKESDDIEDYLVPVRVFDSFGKPAKSGRFTMYNSERAKTTVWDVDGLDCRLHKNTHDARTASKDGIRHDIILHVPETDMQYAGNYYWIFSYTDDHADLYRDHKPKLALEWY